MTLLTGRSVEPTATPDTEALFHEAKRRERKRRLFSGGAVLLLVGGIVAAVSAGGTGHETPSATRPGAPQPRPIALGSAAWSSASVFQADLATQPVALPGTPYAYAIEVRSDSPTSPTGRLVRIDLANGAVTLGAKVTDAQQMFVLGDSVALLALPRSAASADRLHAPPYVLKVVIGHTAALATAHNLHLLNDRNQVVTETGPLVDGEEFWIADGDTAYALNPTSDTIARQLNFGALVASIAVAPGGNRFYVALNELIAHPTTLNPTIVEEIDATTGRVLEQRALAGAELGWASLVAVKSGVWASYKGGMDGTVALLRSTDLSIATPTHALASPEVPVPTAGETAGGSISAAPLGGVMWLTSAAGVSCVTPGAGRFLAGTAFPRTASSGSQSWVPFASFERTLYATTNVASSGATRILAIRPPASCA